MCVGQDVCVTVYVYLIVCVCVCVCVCVMLWRRVFRQDVSRYVEGAEGDVDGVRLQIIRLVPE